MGEVIAFFAGAMVGMFVMAIVAINRKTESEDDEQERYIRNLIRDQADRINETPEEYIARKYGIGGNTVDKGNATELPEQERRDRGAGLDAKKPVAG